MRVNIGGKNNPNWRGGKEKTRCSFCRKVIYKWPSKIKKYNYCNNSCRQKGKHPLTEFKNNHVSWNRGIKTGVVPPNVFKKGNVPWNKGQKRQDICQERHWNWQGGITPKIIKIRRSFEYKQWRNKVLYRDNYICQLCGKRGGRLQADHIFQFSILYKELDRILESNFEEIMKNTLLWDIRNGRTLCKKCHAKVTKEFLSKK